MVTEQTHSHRVNLRNGSILISGFFFIFQVLSCSGIREASDKDTFIQDHMKRKHIPGLAVSIVKGEEIVWSKGFGWANLEEERPMDPSQSLQNIGSISKTVTATAVMQLWEKGAFKLDDDVNERLPFSVRNPAYPEEPITFLQLLTHRSSIKDGPAYSASYACGDPTLSLREWLEGYFTPGGKFYDPEGNFHSWKPGEKGELPNRPRNYSNVGFGLLGYLVEVVSEMLFSEYCQQHIFKPLGMANTSWYTADLSQTDQAVPYSYISKDFELEEGVSHESTLPKYGLEKWPPNPETYHAHCFYSFPNYPDGLVRTSTNQLARFLMAYMNGGIYKGIRLLKEESVRKMFTIQNETDDSQGLCWRSRKLDDDVTLWGHGGGDPGIQTGMYFSPEHSVGVIVFTNCSDGGVNDMIEYFFHDLLK